MTLIRYPGSKFYLYKTIMPYVNKFPVYDNTTYVEPFAGSLAVGLKYLDKRYKNNGIKVNNIWINDKNIAVTCMWKAIIEHLSDLQKMLYVVKPSPQLFYKYRNNILDLKRMPTSTKEIVDIGFQKIAVHRWSYKGYGEYMTSPQGGKRQNSMYKINMIWNPHRVFSKLRKIKKTLRNKNVIITNLSFEDVLKNVKENDVVYLDPPHINQKKIYQINLTPDNHKKLSQILSQLKSQWVLSYDICPEVKSMYSWAKINEIHVSCKLHEYMEKNEYIIHK
jgi:DNA adenine methylase